MSVGLVGVAPSRVSKSSTPAFRRQLFLSEPGIPMGEVRVKVTLTNAYDAMLADEGRLPEDKVRSCEVEGMVDTGAVCSVIPKRILDGIGVTARSHREATFADGRTEDVPVSHPLLVLIEGRDMIEEAMIFGEDVLIGQTVLERTDLLVDCANCTVVPNPRHPNGPAFRV